MKFLSWKDMAERDTTSVSTQKRLYATDPRYPHKVQLSPNRVGFPEDEADAYAAARIAEAEAAGEMA